MLRIFRPQWEPLQPFCQIALWSHGVILAEGVTVAKSSIDCVMCKRFTHPWDHSLLCLQMEQWCHGVMMTMLGPCLWNLIWASPAVGFCRSKAALVRPAVKRVLAHMGRLMGPRIFCEQNSHTTDHAPNHIKNVSSLPKSGSQNPAPKIRLRTCIMRVSYPLGTGHMVSNGSCPATCSIQLYPRYPYISIFVIVWQ